MIPMDGNGHFLNIDADECWRLLGPAGIGRVAWQSSRGITLLPVNYARLGPVLVLRVAHDSILAELIDTTEVAFEVDDIELSTASGWSVVVRGTSGPWHGDDPGDRLPMPWAPGQRPVLIGITPSELTGRVVSARQIGGY